MCRLSLLVHDGNHTQAASELSAPENCFAGFGGTAGTSRASLLQLWAKVSLGTMQINGRFLRILDSWMIRKPTRFHCWKWLNID